MSRSSMMATFSWSAAMWGMCGAILGFSSTRVLPFDLTLGSNVYMRGSIPWPVGGWPAIGWSGQLPPRSWRVFELFLCFLDRCLPSDVSLFMVLWSCQLMRFSGWISTEMAAEMSQRCDGFTQILTFQRPIFCIYCSQVFQCVELGKVDRSTFRLLRRHLWRSLVQQQS